MSEEAPVRKIIHVDMDAFFAAIEQRDNPDLRGKPIAVGGSGERGVVAAASYEARKFGVHSALSSRLAAQRCPDLIFVKHRFDVYKEVSSQVMGIFRQFTDLVEPLSLDEAFLDVTHNKKGMKSATHIAEQIRLLIRTKTKLTASAGVSINKFLAKVASDINKPDGMTVITPDEAEAFIEKLDIHKIPGVGKVTAAKMKKLGIFTGMDLKMKDDAFLTSNFGKAGGYYCNISRGIDNRPVQPNRERKSIGAERTFEHDKKSLDEIHEALNPIAEEVARRCKKSKSGGRTLTVKIKFNDFTQITRSKTAEYLIAKEDEILSMARDLVPVDLIKKKPVRLLGISMSSLNDEPKEVPANHQLTLKL